jgi:hypothetical protein
MPLKERKGAAQNATSNAYLGLTAAVFRFELHHRFQRFFLCLDHVYSISAE